MTKRFLSLAIGASSVGLIAATNAAQDRSAVRAIQVAEDSRRTDSASMRPLRNALRDNNVAIQALAVRAYGRMEQPALIPEVAPFLSSADANVRIEAAQALAQMVMSARLQNAARAAEAATVFQLLRDAAAREREPRVKAALARSLSRIPLAGQEQIREVENIALALAGDRTDSAAQIAGLLSAERLIRLNNRTTPPSGPSISILQSLAVLRSMPAPVRLYAFMSLSAAGRVDEELLLRTFDDPDEQVRRVTAASATTLQNMPQRDRIVNALMRDSSQLVRVEMVRGWLRLGASSDCAPLIAAVSDHAANVALAAIDALLQADRCPAAQRPKIDSTLAELVLAGVRTEPGMIASPGMTAANRVALHKASHALVIAARRSLPVASASIGMLSTHSSWIVRMYTARAAGIVRDTAALMRMSLDANGNVRSEAIVALSSVARPSGTQAYLAGLEHSDYNVVRVAAAALAQSPQRFEARTALLNSLARITSERKETSRDARTALLTRIAELAAAPDSNALKPYLADYDPVIAARAAQILAGWTNRAIDTAEQTRLRTAPTPPPPPDDVPNGTRLRFIMSPIAGGSIFEIALNSEIAPYTASRVVRLARAGYYNGLTFHRIAPNFVVQGGSPGANEYVGDGPFMRDELWLDTHARGTLGISTRGRDTGDAQIFINTVDNPRLDFDYTVFARVTYGMQLVDTILEGDIIERVEVLSPVGR